MSDDMDNAFNRLKAAAESEARAHYDAGKKAGEKWAKERAKHGELKRLAKAVAYSGSGGAIGTPESYIAAGSDREYFVEDFLVWDMTIGDVNPIDFWEAVLGENDHMIKDEGFATGFIAGALWVWEEFKASGA